MHEIHAGPWRWFKRISLMNMNEIDMIMCFTISAFVITVYAFLFFGIGVGDVVYLMRC